MGVYALVVSVAALAYRWAERMLSLPPFRACLSAAGYVLRALGSRFFLVQYATSSLSWGHLSCVKSVAVIGDHVYTGCWDFLVKKWDARTGACVLTFVGHRQDIIGIAVAGQHLFSCGDYCRLWNTETGVERTRFGVGTYYCAIANATHVFAARANGAIEMFRYKWGEDVTTETAVVSPERTLTGHLAGVMDFDMRGDILISASIDMTARMWCISTGEALQTFAGHRDALRCCCLWRDNLLTGSLDKSIRKWSLASGECLGVAQGHTAAVRALVTVGDSLYSASSDTTITEWDLRGDEPRQLRSLAGHSDGVFSLFEHDGHLYSGSADRTCKRWNLRSGTVTQEYTSRKLVETPAVVFELLTRMSLRDALPVLAWLRPLWRLDTFVADVRAASKPSSPVPLAMADAAR